MGKNAGRKSFLPSVQDYLNISQSGQTFQFKDYVPHQMDTWNKHGRLMSCIGPVDGNFLIKANDRTLRKDECIVCAAGVNTHHYASGPCVQALYLRDAGRKPQIPRNPEEVLVDRHPPLCLLFFLACEHTPS